MRVQNRPSAETCPCNDFGSENYGPGGNGWLQPGRFRVPAGICQGPQPWGFEKAEAKEEDHAPPIRVLSSGIEADRQKLEFLFLASPMPFSDPL